MKRFLLCLVMVLYGCTCVVNANAESFVVGLMNADRPPYFWRDQTGGYRGLFIDVLDELSKETGLHFSYKALPKARIRLYMIVGKIDVEMGIATEWRKKKAEVKNSVYSIPFMDSKEVYVTSSMQGSFDSEQNVPIGDKFCGILGFSKPKGTSEKSRVDFLSEDQLLKMIDKRRCDYTIMPQDIFRYLLRGNTYNVVASDPISIHAMRLRLTRQHEWLLPRINAALLRMKDSGRLAIILDRYK